MNLKSAGFTLVELLVVIVIVAVLATVTVTVVFRMKKSADRAWALNAMRQLQTANIGYATENNGSYVPPEQEVVDENGIPTGTYQWFENPDLISQIKGDEATFSGSGGIDISLPVSMMDRVVVNAKSVTGTTLGDCFGYTVPADEPPFRQAQVTSPADSAAFITCDEPFIDYDSRAKIAYRHQDTALVVYYDGRAVILKKAEFNRINQESGAEGLFWKADSAAGPTP